MAQRQVPAGVTQRVSGSSPRGVRERFANFLGSHEDVFYIIDDGSAWLSLIHHDNGAVVRMTTGNSRNSFPTAFGVCGLKRIFSQKTLIHLMFSITLQSIIFVLHISSRRLAARGPSPLRRLFIASSSRRCTRFCKPTTLSLSFS